MAVAAAAIALPSWWEAWAWLLQWAAAWGWILGSLGSVEPGGCCCSKTRCLDMRRGGRGAGRRCWRTRGAGGGSNDSRSFWTRCGVAHQCPRGNSVLALPHPRGGSRVRNSPEEGVRNSPEEGVRNSPRGSGVGSCPGEGVAVTVTAVAASAVTATAVAAAVAAATAPPTLSGRPGPSGRGRSRAVAVARACGAVAAGSPQSTNPSGGHTGQPPCRECTGGGQFRSMLGAPRCRGGTGAPELRTRGSSQAAPPSCVAGGSAAAAAGMRPRRRPPPPSCSYRLARIRST